VAYSRPEPLGGKHVLEGFDCGEESLNTWLHRYSRHAEAADTARTFVTTSDGKQVVGFFSLTLGQVQPEDATVRLLKGQPADRPVPVVILARLAVDRAHQGKDLGRSLLQEAMLRFNDLAKHAGVRALAAHALDEQAKAFYLRFGFDESPTDPLHLILLAKDLNRFLDQAGGREGP